MSKIASTIGKIASVVAFVAGVALLFVPGGQVFGVGLMTISGVASAVAAVSMTIAQATMKPPDMKGSVNQVVIGKNMAVPYMMGRTYAGGLQVYDDSAGQDNRWRFNVNVLTVAGPIDSYETFLADYSEITLTGGGAATGYYDGFLDCETKLGARPDTALTSTGTAMPGWTSDHKLSGFAAYRVKMKFDKDGKKFTGGVPQFGWVIKAVSAYDPRLDDTYPGGAGDHRWDDESTWEWTENPALHALTYARGRFVNDIKVVGCGFPQEAINVAQAVELANYCDANSWTIGGTIYEGPGTSKWDNLKRILQAAAAEPVWSGGQLSFKISSPKVSVVTIGLPDLADGEVSVQAMKSWRDKINTVVPRVRLEDQKWEYTQVDEVTDEVYLTEDGEAKTREVQFDLVQNGDQGAQLAGYELVNSREFGPIQIPLKPYFMPFKPGEAVEINLPEAGMEGQLAVITGRTIDPGTGVVTLTLESETTAKHAFALGLTSTAPPTPTIHPPEVRDQAIGSTGIAETTQLIASSYTTSLTFTLDDAGDVVISTHDRVYLDKIVAVTGDTLMTSADADDLVLVYYDDPDRAGGAVTYQALLIDEGVGETDAAFASADNPYRHFVAVKKVPATGSSGGGSGAGSGGGGGMPGGGGGLLNYQ